MAAPGGVRARRGRAGTSEGGAAGAAGAAGSGARAPEGRHPALFAAAAATAAALAGAAGLWALGLLPPPWPTSRQGPARQRASAPQQAPAVYGYRVVRKYRHDPAAFTQGLLWLNDTLYESTGLYKRSSVREVRLHSKEGAVGTSEIVRKVALDGQHFGEGLVHMQDELLQLLWRRGDGLRYSVRAGDGGHLRALPHRAFKTPLNDGWGLTTDGKALLVTDSGADVFFLDPESLAQQKSLHVTDNGTAIEMLNELEFIDGELWANVFGQECLARINLDTGSVVGWVVLTDLLNWAKARKLAKKKGREMPDIMNGIAWDPLGRRLFITGKLWPLLFEIEVIPTTNISLEEARRRCIPPRNIFRSS